MRSHTPGPWRADGPFVVDANDQAVCEVTQSTTRGAAGCAEIARRIAAVDDLLAALRRIAGAEMSDPHEFRGYAQECALAAITKATGGAA